MQLKSLDEGHRARKTVQKSEQKRASIFLKIIQCHAVHGKPIGVDSENSRIQTQTIQFLQMWLICKDLIDVFLHVYTLDKFVLLKIR